MKIQKRKEIIFHKIKVNKNIPDNKFNNSQNNFNIRDKYNFSLETNSPNNSNVYSYYKNNNKVPYVIIKNYKLNSSSEEKLLNNKNRINYNNNQYYQGANYYIEPKINHTKSLLNNENSDKKILNSGKLNNNNNMRNQRKIYRRIIDSENLEYNKSKDLSLKTGYANDNNNIYKNKEFKTIENNNINNYINEFKLINNYYENDNRNKNNYNIRTFHDKYAINNSLDNSSERNIRRSAVKRIYNNQRKANPDYIIDYNNSNNNNKNYKNNYQKILSLRNTVNGQQNSNDYFSYQYNNSYKNLNQNKINEKYIYPSVYIKRKSPYRRKEYEINEYNNKGDNYKKLFNIYRGKLVQEFIKHLKKAVNIYLLKELKNIIEFVKNNNYFYNNYIHQNRKNRSINKNNFKKINSLPKININYYFDREINYRKENNPNKNYNKRYTKIYYSEKKYNDEINFKKNLTSRNEIDIKPKNIYKIIKNTENNQIISKDSNKLLFNNELMKIIEKGPIPRINYTQKREIKRTNFSNIEEKNIIYKKKINPSNYNALNIKKLEPKNNPINITTQNKIIDIDINLGKPIKEISDISLLKNFESNKNRIKFDKNKKHGKRSKTRRKYSLPKKKYLEEMYEQNNNEEGNLSLPYKTYSYDCKKTRINRLVNLNNEMSIINEKDKEIFLDTKDKLLTIRLNYLFSWINNGVNKSNSFNKNILKISKNENIFICNKDKGDKKNENISILSLIEFNNSRNSNDLPKIEKQNSNMNNFINDNSNKYLLSCIKFMTKAINKALLRKEFAHFKKCI